MFVTVLSPGLFAGLTFMPFNIYHSKFDHNAIDSRRKRRVIPSCMVPRLINHVIMLSLTLSPKLRAKSKLEEKHTAILNVQAPLKSAMHPMPQHQ